MYEIIEFGGEINHTLKTCSFYFKSKFFFFSINCEPIKRKGFIMSSSTRLVLLCCILNHLYSYYCRMHAHSTFFIYTNRFRGRFIKRKCTPHGWTLHLSPFHFLGVFLYVMYSIRNWWGGFPIDFSALSNGIVFDFHLLGKFAPLWTKFHTEAYVNFKIISLSHCYSFGLVW